MTNNKWQKNDEIRIPNEAQWLQSVSSGLGNSDFLRHLSGLFLLARPVRIARWNREEFLFYDDTTGRGCFAGCNGLGFHIDRTGGGRRGPGSVGNAGVTGAGQREPRLARSHLSQQPSAA